MSPSLYDDLGVSRTATDAEIRKAYKRLARKHHPDLNPGDKAAEEHFKRISAAYDVLGDPERRKLYDEFGEDSTRTGFDPDQARAHKQWQQQASWRPGGRRARSAEFDADLFESLFGGRARRPARGRDVHADLATDFRTAALGGVRTLTFGDGRTLSVRIPPGVEDGGSIRLRGKGAPGPQGTPAGDLVITLHVEADPVFRREGLDLHIDVPVTVVEAVRGGQVEIPTLDGRVRLRIPPHSQAGDTLRIKGKGIPHGKRSPGDLYAHLTVVAPDRDVSAEALDTLAAAYGTDPRHRLWEAT